MPQPPFPPGEPATAAREAAEASAARAGDPFSPPRSAPRQPASAWQEISWVGFADDSDAAAPRSAVNTSQPAAPQAMTEEARASGSAADAAPDGAALRVDPADAWTDFPGSRAIPSRATGTVDSAMPRRAMLSVAALAHRVRQLSSGFSRLLRLAVAAATMGAVAVFAYQGGERIAASVGASVGPAVPAAAPVHPAAALAAPEIERPAAVAATNPPMQSRGDPSGPADQRAVYYLDRARAGDPLAQFNVAALYAQGDGLAQDFGNAAAWFREAATSGNAAAQFNLAVMYERGLGVGQNPAEAIAWYRRAAEQDYGPAQYNLGVAYAEGRAAARDGPAATRWYRQAAAHGVVAAMVNLAILYEKGDGIERSLPDAYAWYRAAARDGDGAAERRGRELFQQFSGEEKGRAVMAAAAIVRGVVDNAAASKAPAAPKTAAARGATKPGIAVGRSVVEPKPAAGRPPAQPTG